MPDDPKAIVFFIDVWTAGAAVDGAAALVGAEAAPDGAGTFVPTRGGRFSCGGGGAGAASGTLAAGLGAAGAGAGSALASGAGSGLAAGTGTEAFLAIAAASEGVTGASSGALFTT